MFIDSNRQLFYELPAPFAFTLAHLLFNIAFTTTAYSN